jgi:hypothetical protein
MISRLGRTNSKNIVPVCTAPTFRRKAGCAVALLAFAGAPPSSIKSCQVPEDCARQQPTLHNAESHVIRYPDTDQDRDSPMRRSPIQPPHAVVVPQQTLLPFVLSVLNRLVSLSSAAPPCEVSATTASCSAGCRTFYRSCNFPASGIFASSPLLSVPPPARRRPCSSQCGSKQIRIGLL